MKRDLAMLVGGILLGGAAMLVVLPGCGGSAGGNAPTPATPQATATSQPIPTSVPAATETPAPTPTQSAVPASIPAVNNGSDDLLAKGKLIFEKTAGRVGCASCHGLNAKGTTTVGAPDIRGKTEAQVRAALAGGVAMMSFIKLSDDEITAVVAYLQYLNEQP